MTINEYKELINDRKFIEFPYVNSGTELVSPLINYSEADSELRIHLCKLIICRSFYGTYTAWVEDVNWFLTNFFLELERDLIKPHLTATIKEASAMILSGEVFTKGTIGANFMFGVLEFYAKYELGFRPTNYNFFDKANRNYIKKYAPKLFDLSIKSAFSLLQEQNLPISDALNSIDQFTKDRLVEHGIPDKDWIRYSIADRLSLARNPMLHGEHHGFYGMGQYTLMLYSLFHLTRLQNDKYSS